MNLTVTPYYSPFLLIPSVAPHHRFSSINLLECPELRIILNSFLPLWGFGKIPTPGLPKLEIHETYVVVATPCEEPVWKNFDPLELHINEFLKLEKISRLLGL